MWINTNAKFLIYKKIDKPSSTRDDVEVNFKAIRDQMLEHNQAYLTRYIYPPTKAEILEFLQKRIVSDVDTSNDTADEAHSYEMECLKLV